MANYKLFNSICAHVVRVGAPGPEFFATLDPRLPAPPGSTFTLDFKRTPSADWRTAVVDDPGINTPNMLDANSPFDALGSLYVEAASIFPRIAFPPSYPWPNGTGYTFDDYQFQSMVYEKSLDRYHGFRALLHGPIVPGDNPVTVESFWNGAPYDVDILLDFADPKQCAPDRCSLAPGAGRGSVFIHLDYCAKIATPGGGATVLRGPKQPPYG